MPDKEISLVLASSSPRRRELLQALGLKFQIIPSGIDEETSHKDPSEIVTSLALSKAIEVSALQARQDKGIFKTVLILGADTIVVLGGEILSKPTSAEHAQEMLKHLSGCCHKVYTGVALVELPTRRSSVCLVESKVYFRPLDLTEINYYVKSGEGADKAGSYALQGIGSSFVEKIEGCFTNVIGLPLPTTIRMLREAGLSVLGVP